MMSTRNDVLVLVRRETTDGCMQDEAVTGSLLQVSCVTRDCEASGDTCTSSQLLRQSYPKHSLHA
jgi:hypothetical protein